MKKIILFAFSAFLALLAGCTADSFAPVAIPNHYSVKPPEPVNERDLTEQLKKLHTPDTSPYKITPGDQFDITVYEHPELTVRQIIVTPDGFVSAPLIGPVKIGGLSLVEATEALKKQISQYIRKPLVSLIPIRINGYNFTIVGRVNVPGCYPISIGNTRLIDAVAMARGLSEGLFHGDTVELADLENAYISRDGRLLPVNFQKALLRGDPLHNIPLKNGDYIYIPSERGVIALSNIRELGSDLKCSRIIVEEIALCGNRHSALADIEVEKLVYLRLVFKKDILAANAYISRAALNVDRYVGGLDPEITHACLGILKDQLSRVFLY